MNRFSNSDEVPRIEGHIGGRMPTRWIEVNGVQLRYDYLPGPSLAVVLVHEMGGMLESRIALSAFAHFALAHDNVVFYDMDTCMLGHKIDPVTGGVRYNGYYVEVPDTPGIGADADDAFLTGLEKISI